MNVSGSSDISGFLADQATAMRSEQIQQTIGTAVLKKIMDQAEQQGAALVEMIQQTPAQPGQPGFLVDIRA